MKQMPFLRTALKGRPRIFQLITLSLFSFSVLIIVMSLISASKNEKSSHPVLAAAYAVQQKQTPSFVHNAKADLAQKK